MRTICFILCIATSAFSLADEVRSPGQPNIVLILADDLGYSDLGCYGGEIRTPNIDALAAGGVRFTQLYNSARCCPSRASLMTGLYPSQAGIGDFTTPRPSPTRGPGYLGRLNEQCVTLAEVLKPAGYGCYYVGKWHMHPETGPIRRGFDEFYGYTNDHSHDQYDADYYIRLPEGRTKEIDPPRGEFYATDVFNQYALEFIRQAQQTDKPWFLFLGHSSPHFPVQAPAERADKYEETYRRGWDVLREERFARMRKLGLIDGPRWKLTRRSIVPVDRDDIANGFSGQPNPAWESLDEDRRHDLARRMAVFAAMVQGVDQGLGQIVEHLKKTGDFDNTLILFLSDNGACYEWGPFGFDGVSRRGTTTLHTGEDLRKIGRPGTHHSYGSAWANLGNTPFRLYKHFTHEGGISTPFIAHWPKGGVATRDEAETPSGTGDQPVVDSRELDRLEAYPTTNWIRDPAHVMDIMPTILDAAGANYPATHNGNAITPMEGTSLLPRMRGEDLPERVIGFDHQAAHALRRGDWKIVWSKRMPHEIQWELYNLAEDRCETNDLAEKHPDRVREMAAEWERWARRVGVIYESADDPPKSDSPLIANRPLTISGHVESEEVPEKGVGSLLRETHPSDATQKRLPTPLSIMPGRKKFGSVTKPVFADPNYHGSCDPEIVWNPLKQKWFIYYTARRATREQATYVGTPLGVISSPDLVNWQFRGYCSFDGSKGMPDNEDTHWAPGIITAGDQLHMFATYKASAKPPWGGDGVIRHYVAPLDNPIDGWKLAGVPEFQQPDPIDVSLLKVNDEFHAYYRVGRGGGIQWATGPDLSQWKNHGKCLGDVNAPPEARGFGYQEAPYVFQWHDRYWMLTDPHEGLAVFHSPDGITWTQQQRILREPGEGEADATLARHPSVAVLDERAFIFYHTEPNRPYPTPPPAQRTPHQKISLLQMAELEIENGRLVCDRNAEITLDHKSETHCNDDRTPVYPSCMCVRTNHSPQESSNMKTTVPLIATVAISLVASMSSADDNAQPARAKGATAFPNEAFIQQKTDRKPGPVMDAETIRAGLKSHDRALYIKAGWIRDPYITLGPDDYYYLTGTQPNPGDPREVEDPYNIGLGPGSIVGEKVRLWRSKDLIEWEYLGEPFTLDDTYYVAEQGKQIRNRLIWAPEVHWMGDRWAIVHCPASHSSLAVSAGPKLAGPWTHPMGEDLGKRHDPSLFQDDDGTWYLLWQNTLVAPLSSDLSRYTAEPVRIDPAGTRPGPNGEPISRIGHEGATMLKVGGKYVHLGTAWSTDQGRKGSYNLYYCVADKITGPYGARKFAGRFLGHGTPFQTRDGKWWCTAFFNANVPPLPRAGIENRDLSENAQTINEQGVTIVPLDVRMLDHGEVYIRAKDPAYATPGPDEVQKFSE